MSLTTIEQLLENKIGLRVDTVGSDTIASAIRRRMEECEISDNTTYLTYLNTSGKEWDELIEAVVVPETWFFRNQESFTFLSQYVKTEWIPKHKNDVLQVLSVPCSTGEEPYSIAMTVMEVGLPKGCFSIDAVDISCRGLHKAKYGVYGQESFRRQDMFSFRERYFTLIPEGYQIDSSIRDSVRFIQGNLLENHIFSETKPYDIIFCRNLLIYLSPSARKKVIDVIDRLLIETGILFVGHAERPLFQAPGFVSITVPGVFAYYRTGYWDESRLCQQHRKPQRLERRKGLRDIFLPPQSGPVPSRVSPKSVVTNTKPSVFIEQRKPLDETVRILSAARGKADQGNLEEALKLCGKVLARNAAHVQANFLMGLIYQALGNDTQAENYFNKTIYLDPNHHEALYYLALIMEDRGEYVMANQLRRRIQRIYQRTMKD